MKLYLWIATLIGVSASIAQSSSSIFSETQTFKCYERASKFAHGSTVATVVNINSNELVVTSLRGEVPSAAYRTQDGDVANTRTGQWLKYGDFTMEANGNERRAYYHYNAKRPTDVLTLKCFSVQN